MHLTVHDVLDVVRRRKRVLVASVIAVTVCSALGAFLLPQKFESSTTILVQRDEVLNPLVSFTMAVTMASEDRLRTFNEIIYSKVTLQMLIDSLQLGPRSMNEEERQELVEEVRKHIETERRGSDSFQIRYLDTHPLRAQQGAFLLARHFIKMILEVENKRNETAVAFFETKLEDLRGKFEESQKRVVVALRERLTELPVETRALYSGVEETKTEMQSLRAQLEQYQDALTVLKSFPRAMETESGKKSLFALLQTTLPYVDELGALLLKYDELTRRYTRSYPEVQKLTFQVLDLIGTIRSAVEADIPKKRKQLWDLERRHSAYVEDLKKSSVTEKQDDDKLSNYDIYRKLYDEMKIKLEQATTSRDLGRKGGEQFLIIDPPLVPSEASKPKRAMIILGGFGLGWVLGIIGIAATEILDTTIRSKRDVEEFRKPIIAFLPEGSRST